MSIRNVRRFIPAVLMAQLRKKVENSPGSHILWHYQTTEGYLLVARDYPE